MLETKVKFKEVLNNKRVKNILFVLTSFSLIFITIKILNTIVFINAHVPSPSMENTIMTEDRFIANRLAYSAEKKPERFDVIVFEAPDNPNKLLVKRIIGIPGDKVEFIDGQLFLNDKKIEETYLSEVMYGSYGPYYVPESKYLTLGDNRNNSIDSRQWFNTFVDIDSILGKAYCIYFPKIQLIN